MKTSALLALLPLLPLAALADNPQFVTVSATAQPNLQHQPQSYVFLQGKFFPSGTRDSSIDKMSFTQLVTTLAPELAKQNFFPTRDVKNANLVIVVNWGTTLEDYNSELYNPEAQFQQQQENDDLQAFLSGSAADAPMGENIIPPSLGFDHQLERSTSLSSTNTQQQNAALLGYNAELLKEEHRSWGSPKLDPEYRAHLDDLVEERYFVILLAYDYQDLQRSHAAGAKAAPKPLWEVRMNMKAIGNNFTEALPAMAKVAAAYYGHGLDGLATVRTDADSAAHVTIGAAQVIEVVK